MENKKAVVLDEWAAEQDPEFRKYFYKRFSDYLRHNNYTVIAVTHDDRYFDSADRVLKFEFGKVISDESVKKSQRFNFSEL